MKKRMTSIVVLIAIFMGIVPTDIFANSQSPITSGLTLTSNAGSAGYTVTVEWMSPKTDNTVPSVTDHPTAKFDINIENVTNGKKETPVEIDAKANDHGGIKYVENVTKDLDDGYLYRFSVEPYHFHSIVDKDGNVTIVKAPMGPSAAIDNQAFFLTDIKVNGTGEGNSLTITWDNPSDLIDKYLISYNKILTDSSGIVAQGRKEVEITDPNLTIITDKDRANVRYQYTITNESVISPANMYDITVEPIFNGGTYEVVKKNATITEKGKKIPVTVKDRGADSGKYKCVITTDLPLFVEEIDSTNLKLTWVGLDEATINSTEKLEILQSTDPKFDSYTVIGTLYNDGCRIGSWITAKPKTTVYYRVVVTFKDTDKKRPPMYSKIVTFNPKIIPYVPNKPDILKVTPIVENKNYSLDMIWSAFIRPPYDEDEREMTVDPDGKIYVDRDIKYDIWLSDDITGLYNNKISPILADAEPSSLNNLVFMNEQNNPIIAYSTILKQYYKKTEETYVKENLIPNKLYYIKIVAKKTFDTIVKESEPEYLLIYFNDSGNIFLPPMMSKPPLKVRKDDNGKEMIGKNEVTIEWKTKWWEIFNKVKDEWATKFKAENNALVFDLKKDEDGVLIRTEEDMKNKIVANVTEKVYYRPVIFDEEIKYEYMVVPYVDIEKFAKDNYMYVEGMEREKIYDEYVKKHLLPKETPTTSLFKDITNPTIDPKDTEKVTLFTEIKELQSNTEYVILFRAYRVVSNDIRLKSDPAYLTITTLPEEKDLTEIPTVPSLYLKDKDDINITVKWKDDGFKYELVISEKPLEDPATGTIIPIDEIEKNGIRDKEDPDLKANVMSYKITGLFPSTQYHIWIRAISDTAPKPSAWSTPLQVTTDPLKKPLPPDGLGLVSKESLLYVNSADSTKYNPVHEKYLIVEWLKDPKDNSGGYKTKPAEGKDENSIVGNMLGAPEVKSSMITMFNNLVPFRYYYIRVATRVTVIKGNGKDGVEKKYSYIIQIADNDLFVDAIQIEIPEEFTLGEKDTFRTEISDFTKPIRIRTDPNDGEYDSDKDPDLYPLPDQDFELIYDPTTNTLTYRLRSNEKDKDGMPDNRVDQRFISKLIRTGVYIYDINVSNYSNKKVDNRVIEIPYTILETFKQRDIDVKVVADNLTMTLPANWLSNEEERLATNYGDSSKLIITLNQGHNGLSNLVNGNMVEYISTPQKVSMQLKTPQTTTQITSTAEPIGIQMKLDHRYDIYDKNISPYIYDNSSSEWERIDADYDNEEAVLKFKTNDVSAYTSLAISAPYSDNESKYFKSLANEINITDMKFYNANDSVTANQLSNLLYGIANNKKDIKINEPLGQVELNSLSKAGLSLRQMGDINVERQEAINAIAKLYEIKTGSKINEGSIANSALSDINNVSAQYLTGILKAEEIGLLNASFVRPNEPINIDEMSYMLDMVIKNSK